MNPKVECLSTSSVREDDVAAVNSLLEELSPHAAKLTLKDLMELVRAQEVFVIKERTHIVGMATLIIYRKPTGKVGVVEDVVVKEEARGKGYGRLLMVSIVMRARIDKLQHLNLTSRPSRKAGNRLYTSLGFKRRYTNCYRLAL